MMSTLDLIARLMGLTAVIHGIEFLWIRRRTEEAWAWPIIEAELGRPFRVFLAPSAFFWLNIFRCLIGIVVMVEPSAAGLWILFLMHVLTLLRWLGTFNGGSDYMTLLLLWATALGLSYPENLGRVCLYYITFQLCFSYFKAGWIKFKNPRWRDGSALRGFIGSPIYATSAATDIIQNSPSLSRAMGWGVILFEVSFPLALLHVNIAIVYMSLAAFFHLTNAYVFGLNRFFFAWVSAYPALYYAARITLGP